MSVRRKILCSVLGLGTAFTFGGSTAFATTNDVSWTPGGITNNQITVSGSANVIPTHSSTSTVRFGGENNGVMYGDDSSNASFTCGNNTFSNHKNGVFMQGGHAHISIMDASAFIAKYTRALYDKIANAPTFQSGGDTIHSYNGACGINYTLDDAVAKKVPPVKYTYTITLITPWNVLKQQSGTTPDPTGQNLNDQYCPAGAPVNSINGLNVSKSGSETWTLSNSDSSKASINFGCAGIYQIVVSGQGVKKQTIMQPVPPNILPKPSPIVPNGGMPVPQVTNKGHAYLCAVGSAC